MNNGSNVNIVFGIHDHLTTVFNDKDWMIMNRKWSDFTKSATIFESDLWSADVKPEHRSLMNAKLFTISSVHLNQHDMTRLNQFFWIDLLNAISKGQLVSRWRQSMRISLNDILELQSLEKLFEQRRFILNKIQTEMFISRVVSKTSINFISLIRIAVHDGFANNILDSLDRVALENHDNLFLLPRLMSFISIVLSEMSQEFRFLRSGPSLNSKWSSAFEDIESQKVT